MKKIEIQRFKPGKVLQSEDIVKRDGLSLEDARTYLIEKMHEGKTTLVYKLNTDKFIHNPWTPELGLLSKKFTLTDGTVFEGQRLENVLVGFLVCVEF